MSDNTLLWCPNCASPNYASSITAAPVERVGTESRGLIQCVTCHETRNETEYYRENPDEGPITLAELEAILPKTWALNLVDRSAHDQYVFMELVRRGYDYAQAWNGMIVTSPIHNNQGLHDEPMGPNPERTQHVHQEERGSGSFRVPPA